MRRSTCTRVAAAAFLVAATEPGWAAGPLYPNVVSTNPDPLFANLTIPASAAKMGMWLPPQGWPLVGIHSTVMPDGRVLTFGTPQALGAQDGRTLDIWSPALGFAPSSHLTIANGQPVDSFCGAAATLPQTGDVLLSGGGSAGDGYQSFASTLVTPSQASAVNANLALAKQRWYATMITLADGRQLIGGGGTPYTIVDAYNNPAGAAARAPNSCDSG